MSFRDDLEQAASCRPIAQSRLVQIIAGGRCPMPLLRRFAAVVYAGADDFPRRLARLYRHATDERARLHLLDNMMEEEGIVVDANHGLRVIPQNRHTAWAERFTDAVGLSPAEREAAASSLDDGELDRYLAAGMWLEAMGYLLVGMEGNVPATYRPIVQGLRRQGFSADAIIFFAGHISADELHGETGRQLLVQLTPPERRASVVAAVATGAERWWHLHNGRE